MDKLIKLIIIQYVLVDYMYGILVLEDGTVLKGKGFGAEGEVLGELVFNTCMTGYVEILTDPSYSGQIITMTYPLEGNYGVNDEWFESDGIKAEGFVVKDMTSEKLNNFLKEYNIPGISNIDTRFITKRIRSKGVVKALLKTSTEPINDDDIKQFVEMAKNHKDLSEIDLVPKVSTKETIIHKVEEDKEISKCVLIDCGVKKSIIDCLLERNCTVIQVPYNTSAEEILNYGANFVLVSNGPGDPDNMADTINTVKELLGKIPITGICLGHQIISIALGGKTYKMKFGHRGGNQPVEENGIVHITSQNHGYASEANILKEGIVINSINLNDNTVEGLKGDNLLCVQYHPEAAPGPHDAMFLFDEFIKLGLKK